ncbi:NAD(P)-binding protein [Coniochaeta ligniaria NRRL 30616]|uniref:NAD(P)-binding protein n=1 Tax=Coniochaeta ligniaria NRRL 30616 TaxID=1408157 RepID=A0A1J7J585_9PEZI|nr:NAD(P)-binding protein [Coniochaeta ligniaria NRRL 30616]
MVKVAIAGGSGQVAREVIDALLAADKHEITILSRNEPSSKCVISPGLHWRVVDYNDKNALAVALRGTHTLLSFVQPLSETGYQSQKNLIDASIVAQVTRFAPSEWGAAGTVNMPWWVVKEQIRQYLKKVNENGRVLEYTLFQPGLFLDYLASPYQTAKYVAPLDTTFDFQNRRAFVVDGHADAVMTFTTAADLAAVVARAVGYNDGEWSEVSGIRGNRVTVSRVIEIGERVRGSSFAIDKVKLEDLEAGSLQTSWTMEKPKKHQAVSDEEAVALFKTVTIGMLLSSVKGAWDVSDEVNQLFPDYKFEEIETFLARAWGGKP